MMMKKTIGNRVIASLLILVMLVGMMPVSAKAQAYNPDVELPKLGIRTWEDAKPDVGFYINAGNRYILETVPEPIQETSSGDWSVMDLLRGMYTGYDYLNYIPENYFEDYLGRVEEKIISLKGSLHKAKYTEYSRMLLPLSSLGYDVLEVAPHYRDVPYSGTVVDASDESAVYTSYNIPVRYSVKNSVLYKQGINGPIWVLIAMNTGGYKFYTREALEAGLVKPDDESYDAQMAGWLESINITELEDENCIVNETTGVISPKGVSTEGKQIDFILSREITQTDGIVGGWALTGKIPDPDITGMALQALAPYYLNQDKYESAGSSYYSYEEFCKVVERAVYVLSLIQQPNGGYFSWGTNNSESISQVIVALTSLEIDPMSSEVELPHIDQTCSFIKEGGEYDGVYSNNMIDAIIAFWAYGSGSSPEVGGFKHVSTGADGGGGSGTTVNGMATDQAVYGLIAYDRFVKKQNKLYDMTDMTDGSYKSMHSAKQTVTFDYQGLLTNTSQELSPYAAMELPEFPEVSGVTFREWNTKADGSGIGYSNGELLSIPEEDITLYAIYEYNNYKLELVTDGGNLSVDMPDTFNVNTETIVLPTTNEIKKAGYEFVGWYKSQDYTGESYTQVEKGTTENLTFYAKWNLNQVVLNTIELIDRIGEVTLEGQERIQTARNAYDKLSNEEQILVNNYPLLVQAEEKYQQLFDEQQQIETVIAKINEIGTVTLESEVKIKAARVAYDQLSEELKLRVINYKTLVQAEKDLASLKGDQGIIEDVITKIAEIGTVTLESEVKIKAARAAYDQLSEELKLRVTNYKTLVQAEQKLHDLKEELEQIKIAKEELQENINKAEGITADKYTTESFQLMKKSLLRARFVLDSLVVTKIEVQQASNDLTKSIEALVLKPEIKNGWISVKNGWKYYTNNIAAKSKWIEDKKTKVWYYVGQNEYRVTKWQKIDNVWYYFNPTTGIMQTGWQKVSGTWYYLNKSGKMQVGWQKIAGAWYYLDKSGKMQTSWVRVKGIWYYLNQSGKMQVGWQKINSKWYYFDTNGKMETGWQKINGAWYYMDASGKMKTDWLKIKNKWYFLKTNGKMVTGWFKTKGKYYQFNSRGEWTGNTK